MATINDLGYNNILYKNDLDSESIGFDDAQISSGLNDTLYSLNPVDITSGALISNLEQALGTIFSGKTGFNNTETGYRLGIDSSDSLAKFYIGDSSNYLNWTGTALTIVGSITATSGTIGGWEITTGYIYNLQSGTPTSSPSD